MNIVHISSYDINGGAARATYRIHKLMLQNGYNSKMLVLDKTSTDPTVEPISKTKIGIAFSKYIPFLDHIPLILIRKKIKSVWSFAWFSFFLFKNNKILKNADIICLYWVGGGFISPKALRNIFDYNKPIIWRFSDLWPFTGGCHYSDGCYKFIDCCKNCHLLNNTFPVDFANRLFKQKLKYWNGLSFNILCPSKWIESLTRKSAIFKNSNIINIPTGIDINIFKPIDKKIVEVDFTFSKNKKIILFGAHSSLNNTIKGIQFLLNGLQHLNEEILATYQLVLFGADKILDIGKVKIEKHFIGYIEDYNQLAKLYSCADVYVCPSKEENLANTVLESLACGTPVVAFNIGGMPDAIEHKHNGYLATPYDEKDLANGIQWVVNYPDKDLIRKNARIKIEEEFDLTKTTDLYLRWIESIYNNHSQE